MRRVVTVALVVAVAVLGVSTAALAALRLSHSGILPGVSVAGVDLGGASPEEARERLAALVAARESDPVTVAFEDREYELLPEQVGYRVDVDAIVEQALEPGRSGHLLERSWDHVAALWREVELPLRDRVDANRLASWVASVAGEIDADPFPGAIQADPDSLAVTVEPPGPGYRVDQERARDAIRAALPRPGSQRVELPVDTLPARVSVEDVEAVADQARRALEAPLTVTGGDAEVTLQPAQLAGLVGLAEAAAGNGRWTARLHVRAEGTEAAFAEVSGQFEVEPQDAAFDLPREPPVRFDAMGDATWEPQAVDVPVLPSRSGRTFDPDLAATQLAEVLASGVRQVELRLREVEPTFTTEDARALGIDQLIGTFTTYYACCQARVTNIQLLADMVDGTIVAPGEQFSINEISGERTCAKGFRPAGMILRGELVNVCGGGTSQFGTTTFNAAFFAGVQIDQYKAHSWYISRYPMGREATLDYPDLDVKFTNGTGHGILVRTSHTGTSVTVSLYGNNGGTEVSAVHGSPTNHRPFPTQYRENPALPPGTERRIQSGINGFDVVVFRAIGDASGEERERFFTRYVPATEIIERNSAAPAEPDPGDPPPEEPPDGDGGGGGGGGVGGGDEAGGDRPEEPPEDGG